jgi:hypothetical protein
LRKRSLGLEVAARDFVMKDNLEATTFVRIWHVQLPSDGRRKLAYRTIVRQTNADVLSRLVDQVHFNLWHVVSLSCRN